MDLVYSIKSVVNNNKFLITLITINGEFDLEEERDSVYKYIKDNFTRIVNNNDETTY